MSIDDYLERNYDIDKQNCGHFVVEVWKDLTGQNIAGVCAAFLDAEMTKTRMEAREGLMHIRKPESPCIVVMKSPHTETHVGVYIKGKILHLSENGVRYEPLVMLTPYWRMSYYK